MATSTPVTATPSRDEGRAAVRGDGRAAVVGAAVSFLFVPASRPDRYAMALASGADVVIIDLEDAVAPDDKESARDEVVRALSAGLPAPVLVRINAADSAHHAADLGALADPGVIGGGSLLGVVLPKAERAADVADVHRRLRTAAGEGCPVVALVETAVGVTDAGSLCAAEGVARLGVGAADLSVDLDVEPGSPTIDWTYARLVVESRRAGLPGPIASPPFDIRDTEAVAAQASRARSLGAGGQLAIHPAQLDAIHGGFRPAPEDVDWARRVLAAGGGGAAQVDGQMVDKPLRERAERILARRG